MTNLAKTSTAAVVIAQREKIVVALTNAFAADLLTVQELEDRIQKAHNAVSVQELQELAADVPGVASSSALVKRGDDTIANRPKQKTVVTILGSTDKEGEWIVPNKLRVVNVLGGNRIDLREAQLASGVTEIVVTAVLGGVEILIPPGVRVECDGWSVLGSFDSVESTSGSDPNAPVVRIRGGAILGGIEIDTRLPGESARAAKSRRKRSRLAKRKR